MMQRIICTHIDLVLLNSQEEKKIPIKKMFEEYLHFYFIKMIFAFLNRHENCLYINHYIVLFLKFLKHIV